LALFRCVNFSRLEFDTSSKQMGLFRSRSDECCFLICTLYVPPISFHGDEVQADSRDYLLYRTMILPFFHYVSFSNQRCWPVAYF